MIAIWTYCFGVGWGLCAWLIIKLNKQLPGKLNLLLLYYNEKIIGGTLNIIAKTPKISDDIVAEFKLTVSIKDYTNK